MREYYEACASEYDDWYLGRGLFAERERRGWKKELAALERVLASLPWAHTLDVACGTGFLTQRLPGEIVGLDQSGRMLEIARERVPAAAFTQGDAFALPFADGAFERVFTAHFYGHLDREERGLFLTEAARVAPELVVCDAALRPDREREELQERILEDGSSWQVYKRFFGAEELAAELGGGDVLFSGDWFVVVRTP
jgi:ubiquinone/menaquinone biosynthesis C-methylase UbiE